MITDLKHGPSTQTRVADVCIIGGGTAGLTLVREFLKTKCTVVLLESGGNEVEEATQQLYRCEIAGLPHRGHLEGRFRVLGGTSTRWGGQLLPLIAHDIEERDWIGAPSWPLKYVDLVPYYRRVEDLFRVDELPYDPLGAEELPVAPPGFRSDLFQARYAKWPPFARRNLWRLVGADCAAATNFEVILHANVTEIVLNTQGTQVESVLAKSLSAAMLTVQAKYFVVSTGTLETVRLLLASKTSTGMSPGNHADQLGRNFQDHLSLRAAELMPRSPRDLEKTFAPFFVGNTMRTVRLDLSPRVQSEKKLLSCFGQILFEAPVHSGFVELREALRRLQSRQNPWPGIAAWMNIVRDLPYMCRLGYSRYLRHRVAYPSGAHFHLQVDVEQQPNPGSRVTLSQERDSLGMPMIRLDWQIGDRERLTMQEYVRMFRSEWERLNLGEARWNANVFQTGNEWLRDITDVYHQTGGTSMSESPEAGVVDPHLRVHGVANLFLASCSVFPSAGSANPTFTLLALTIRLAEHLKALLGTGPASVQDGNDRADLHGVPKGY